jgi:putative transposase
MTFEGDYRPGRHVVPALHVHLAFVTKYRRGVLDGAMPSCCDTAIRKACADSGAGLREFSGDAGHVRLLAGYPPKVAVSALANSLKGVSARRLRAEFTRRVNRASTRGHFRSPSYLAVSHVGAPLSIIRQYIDQQQRPA